MAWPLGYCDRSPLRLFQVSDISITSKPARRIAPRHALSYLFGAVILAMAINLVASLLS